MQFLAFARNLWVGSSIYSKARYCSDAQKGQRVLHYPRILVVPLNWKNSAWKQQLADMSKRFTFNSWFHFLLFFFFRQKGNILELRNNQIVALLELQHETQLWEAPENLCKLNETQRRKFNFRFDLYSSAVFKLYFIEKLTLPKRDKWINIVIKFK